MDGCSLFNFLRLDLKNTNRGKIRRRRQLREQRQRIESRGKRKYVPGRFMLGQFFKRHKVEFFFLAIIVAGVFGVFLLGPDKRAMNEMSSSMSSIIEGKSQLWQKAYPHGYKIIALTDKNIIHTSFDTLPEELEIDWDNLSISRIQADQFKKTNEKIKIKMSGINYAPAGVSGLTISTTFTRRKGATVSLIRFNKLEFVVEIIEDDGSQIFCLLGLRGK